MFFWFKKKKIILDCFTDNRFAYEYCKIAPAIHYYPEWYEDLPAFITPKKIMQNTPSLRHCVGFTELYKKSFIIPYWTTSTILVDKVNKTIRTKSIDQDTLFSDHDLNQINGFCNQPANNTTVGHLKFLSPWWIKSNKFVQFTWHNCTWGMDKLYDLLALPAVIDFKYNRSTEINMVLDFNTAKDTMMYEPGTPLVMLTPLTDESIEIRTHYVNDSKINISRLRTFQLDPLTDNRRKLYQLKKKFINKVDKINEIEENDKKCPFGFGKRD